MPEGTTRRPETRDIAPRLVMAFAGGLVAFLAAILFFLWLVFGGLPSPLPFGARTGLDPATVPILQTDARADRAAFDRAKAAELEETGWVDRWTDIARIPIEDAMRIIAGNGLPHWGGTAAAPMASDCALLRDDVPRAPQATNCAPPAENQP